VTTEQISYKQTLWVFTLQNVLFPITALVVAVVFKFSVSGGTAVGVG